MTTLAEYLKAKAAELAASMRNMWRPDVALTPAKPLKGFRVARTGQHRDTCLTRHEQTRNPPGSKLWNKCPEKRAHDPEWYRGYQERRMFG